MLIGMFMMIMSAIINEKQRECFKLTPHIIRIIVCIGIAASIKQQFSLWKTIRVTTILFPVENLALILVISVPILIKDLYIRLKKKRLQREKQEARWTLWRFLLTLNPRGSSERIWGRKGRREETEPKRG